MTVPGEGEKFARIAALLERERAEARPIVARLRHTIAVQWEREVPTAWGTLGFVEELIEAARAMLDEDTQKSLGLAQLAILIITGMAPGTYPAPLQIQVEATAWKELATTHRFRSEYDAALRALDAGDECLENAMALGHDRAVLKFTRAVVFHAMNRLDDAVPLLEESAAVFEEYGDERLVAQCALLKGNIEYCQGQLKAACESYERALDRLQGTDDFHTLAGAYCNLGRARGDLGQTSEAVTALGQALGIFRGVGMRAEVVRTSWALGNLLLITGDYVRAAEILTDVRNGFLRLTLVEEAGLAGLDLADAWIARGRQRDARVLIDSVRTEFERAQLNMRATTALAYLREMVETPQGLAALRHVRRYIAELRDQPLRVFCPLPGE